MVVNGGIEGENLFAWPDGYASPLAILSRRESRKIGLKQKEFLVDLTKKGDI